MRGARVRGCCKWSAVGMFERKLSTLLHHPYMASSRASTAPTPTIHPPSPSALADIDAAAPSEPATLGEARSPLCCSPALLHKVCILLTPA